MFVSEILHPIHPDKFRNEILGKRMHFWKAPPGVSDRFKSLYDWKKLDSFLNNWQNVNHIQLAGVNEKGEATNDGNDKWDKGRDGKLGKSEVYNLWRHGHSIVLPFCEFQSQEMWSVVNTIHIRLTHIKTALKTFYFILTVQLNGIFMKRKITNLLKLIQ